MAAIAPARGPNDGIASVAADDIIEICFDTDLLEEKFSSALAAARFILRNARRLVPRARSRSLGKSARSFQDSHPKSRFGPERLLE
jgi:hypothetical protein